MNKDEFEKLVLDIIVLKDKEHRKYDSNQQYIICMLLFDKKFYTYFDIYKEFKKKEKELTKDPEKPIVIVKGSFDEHNIIMQINKIQDKFDDYFKHDKKGRKSKKCIVIIQDNKLGKEKNGCRLEYVPRKYRKPKEDKKQVTKVKGKKSFEYYYTKAELSFNKVKYSEAILDFKKCLDFSLSDEHLNAVYTKLTLIYYNLMNEALDEDKDSPTGLYYLKEKLSYLVKIYKLHIKMNKVEEALETTIIMQTMRFLQHFASPEVLRLNINTIEEYDFEIEEYEDVPLPINHHLFLYTLAEIYIDINPRKAKERLQKALLYEYLIFKEKEDQNIISRVNSNSEEWCKMGDSFPNEMNEFKEKLLIKDRSKYKRPFYEYCNSQGIGNLCLQLLADKTTGYTELYNHCMKNYDKEKYISPKKSLKIYIKFEDKELIVGNREWFTNCLLPMLEKAKLITIEYLNETCEIANEGIERIKYLFEQGKNRNHKSNTAQIDKMPEPNLDRICPTCGYEYNVDYIGFCLRCRT